MAVVLCHATARFPWLSRSDDKETLVDGGLNEVVVHEGGGGSHHRKKGMRFGGFRQFYTGNEHAESEEELAARLEEPSTRQNAPGLTLF